MTEAEVLEAIQAKPFRPLRLHLTNGTAIDVMTFKTMMPLRDRLLLFREMSDDGKSAKSFDIVGYFNIKWIELLNLGHRPAGTRSFRR